MIDLDRNAEVELVFSIVNNESFLENGIKRHFLPEKLVFIDNIHGGIDCTSLPMHRETGQGIRYNTWCRARAVIYALLLSMNLPPILSFLENKNITGLGISDDSRYANILSASFSYINTFLHKEPKLDLMAFDPRFESSFDFIICSDVLEHVVGDWRLAAINMYKYLKSGGVLILTAPWNNSLIETIEHYPGSIGYDVLFSGNEYLSTTIHYKDRSETAKNPVFHGGPGNTLEMRLFSFLDLINELGHCGFRKHEYYELNQPLFGITPQDKSEGVLALFR